MISDLLAIVFALAIIVLFGFLAWQANQSPKISYLSLDEAMDISEAWQSFSQRDTTGKTQLQVKAEEESFDRSHFGHSPRIEWEGILIGSTIRRPNPIFEHSEKNRTQGLRTPERQAA